MAALSSPQDGEGAHPKTILRAVELFTESGHWAVGTVVWILVRKCSKVLFFTQNFVFLAGASHNAPVHQSRAAYAMTSPERLNLFIHLEHTQILAEARGPDTVVTGK